MKVTKIPRKRARKNKIESMGLVFLGGSEVVDISIRHGASEPSIKTTSHVLVDLSATSEEYFFQVVAEKIFSSAYSLGRDSLKDDFKKLLEF